MNIHNVYTRQSDLNSLLLECMQEKIFCSFKKMTFGNRRHNLVNLTIAKANFHVWLDWTQYCNNISAEIKSVTCGVSQRSVFLLNINDFSCLFI